MTDLFKLLPPLYWRNIGPLPITSRRVSFEQDIVRHKYMYRDDEQIESVGRKNWTFEYTLGFYEGIRPGKHGYEKVFTQLMPQFIDACRDRSEGDLQDPILGTYQARCEAVDIVTDVNRRDGESVQVRFIYSPPMDAIEYPTTVWLPAVEEQGYSLDSQLSRALSRQDIKELQQFDAGTYNALQEGKNAIGLLDFVAAVGNRAALYGDQIDSILAKYYGKITNVVDALNRVQQRVRSPRYATTIREARRQLAAIDALRDNPAAPSGKLIAFVTTTQDYTVNELASWLESPVTEILFLNPDLPKPLVPAFTKVRYYKTQD